VEAKLQTTAPARELTLIVIATVVFAVLCVQVDLSEHLSAWAQPRERYSFSRVRWHGLPGGGCARRVQSLCEDFAPKLRCNAPSTRTGALRK